jgi:hypothetical protein
MPRAPSGDRELSSSPWPDPRHRPRPQQFGDAEGQLAPLKPAGHVASVTVQGWNVVMLGRSVAHP